MERQMRAGLSMSEDYSRLLAALEEGWYIEPPIYTMTDRLGRRNVYQFVLWRDHRPNVVTVYDSSDIRQFIERHRYRTEVLH